MIDSRWENTGIIQKTLSKLVFIYGFNVVLGLLDEILELKKYVKHESEAGQALDHNKDTPFCVGPIRENQPQTTASF